MDLLTLSTKLAFFFVPFLFSLCFHEYAHGWVAKLRGDNTAERMGRLTMNPIAHIDPIGTLFLPVMAILINSPIFFGWAKPVPVNPRNLISPKKDMFWVALAGPLSNILLALVGAFAYALVVRGFRTSDMYGVLTQLFSLFVALNLFLAFFNLIPLHPLDGGKVLARFLPPHLDQKLEENQGTLGIILMILIISGGLRILAIPVQALHEIFISVAVRLIG